MNYLDIILAIPLLWAVYKGFTKGLIFSVASLLALILGIYGAIHFSFLTEQYIQAWFHPNEKYLVIISFGITFVLIVIIVHLLAWAADKLIKAVALSFFNRLGGLLFNLIKMAFILSVILSLVNYLNSFRDFIPEKDRQESLLYGPVSAFAPAVFPYLKFEEIRKKLENTEQEDPVLKEI
jgi:membrane protein required for colicin V production